jgi:hypothetical protein
MWELKKFSSTSMGRRRSSCSDRRSNNVPRSRHSTGRSPRKSRISNQPHPSKPSSNLWKIFEFERRSRCITNGMPSEESNVRNFWSSSGKRSKQASPQETCGKRKCPRRRHLHPAITIKPKVWRVPLRTQNSSSRHEVTW